MFEQIKAAGRALAEAKANAERARGELADAQAARTRLNDRVAAIATERSTIVAARRDGDANLEHGVRMAVLNADERDLAGLVLEADAAVKAALDTSQAANGAVVRAEQQLSMAADESLLGKLVAHATELDALLLRTTTEIGAICARRRSAPAFFPSPALANQLQRLHLTRQARR